MKNTFFLLVLLFPFSLIFGQSQNMNENSELYKNAPDWAKLMYSDLPNVNEIDVLYSDYYKKTKYVKSYHTQYYKRWRRTINPFLNDLGFFDPSKKVELAKVLQNLKEKDSGSQKSGNNWSAIGPFNNYQEGAVISSGAQANVYSIGRCEAMPNIMYCGTEPGEVYKSIDGATTWVNVSKTLVTSSTPDAVTANAGIHALAVHPTNPNIVYIGSGSEIFKTLDGGLNWLVVFNSNVPLNGYLINPAELYINPSDPQIVMVAGNEGIYRTTDGGVVWNQVVTNSCFDIKSKPGNSNIVYTIRRNSALNTHEFLISSDAGITWTPQTAGWYTSTNPTRYVEGARIAVSAANSNRVYAFLIGDSKATDNGFIGIYRSDDAGVSWVNTMGYDGSPYIAATHPNLISSSAITEGFSFNQGFYNCAIMASNTNADELLVGGIGMWRSSDGGLTFECIYNYTCGSYAPMHVDMQDFRAFGNDYWATTDGGIYKSNDLFNSQPEFKMDGVRAVDFWGFGSGWNRDILVGGTFHNGVDVYAEGFPSGDFLDLVGGEPASGYVSPSGQSRVYSTGMGSRLIPATINGDIINAPFDMSLNEDAWFAESSELEFHPSCYNIVYKGFENKLFKSMDGGASFESIFTASTNTKILGIEISRQNTNAMYIVVRPNTGNGYLVKTTNNWATSAVINFPPVANNLAMISLDPESDQIIWLAYPRGNNGNVVFKSVNGGASWSNQTSSELNGQNIQAITTIGGTNGGVYVGTGVTSYYKNNAMPNWVVDNVNLPSSISATGMRPFYRDGKMRMASFGKGIWESQLYEAPTRPVAKIMVDKLTATQTCNNTFYFDDYSMLNHTGATWLWTFQNASIATSSIRNPSVVFNALGDHLVILTVTNAGGLSSSDSLIVTTSALNTSSINQDFETVFLKPGWTQEGTSSFSWTYNDTVGGFGQSTNCMMFNNFSISQPDSVSDLVIPINMLNLTAVTSQLTFDVAYGFYAPNYADTLQVLVSTDCGVTYSIAYNKGGEVLSTGSESVVVFDPTPSQWRKDTVNLSQYIGNDNVYIKFRNINKYGQALYLDNINMVGVNLNLQESISSNITVFPNPIATNGFIHVKNNTDENFEFQLYNIEGKLIDKIFTKYNSSIPIAQYNLSQGTYIYKIISEKSILNGKLMVTDRK